MVTGQQTWVKLGIGVLLLVLLVLILPAPVLAQESRPSFFADVTKRVVLDPTTYAPAIIAYDATVRDWKSSQPFFDNGFREHNERFTVSGRSNDVAVSYGEGNRRIFKDALANLQVSLVNNVADQVVERVLMERYPDHPKVWRTLGWIQRISFASLMSYRLSAEHYRQAQENAQMATQMGYR